MLRCLLQWLLVFSPPCSSRRCHGQDQLSRRAWGSSSKSLSLPPLTQRMTDLPLAHPSEPALDQWEAKCQHFPEGLSPSKSIPIYSIVTAQQQQICFPFCQSALCSHINTHQMPVLPCMVHSVHKVKNHQRAAWPNREVFKLGSSYSPPDFAQTYSTVGGKSLSSLHIPRCKRGQSSLTIRHWGAESRKTHW